jgi:hypothetical protein
MGTAKPPGATVGAPGPVEPDEDATPIVAASEADDRFELSGFSSSMSFSQSGEDVLKTQAPSKLGTSISVLSHDYEVDVNCNLFTISIHRNL